MLKTVFEEEIKAGDKIMYIYKAYGTMFICFGEVLNIELREVRYHNQPQPRLTVHKTHERSFTGKMKTVDKKVYLTSPTAFKCNEILKYPE